MQHQSHDRPSTASIHGWLDNVLIGLATINGFSIIGDSVWMFFSSQLSAWVRLNGRVKRLYIFGNVMCLLILSTLRPYHSRHCEQVILFRQKSTFFKSLPLPISFPAGKIISIHKWLSKNVPLVKTVSRHIRKCLSTAAISLS